MTEFLTLQAQTLNFTLGRPGQFRVSADGRHVLFCRTSDGTSNLSALWAYDVADGTERLLHLPDAGRVSESAEDRVRRERQRDRSRGVTRYTTDATGTLVAAAVEGRLTLVDVLSGEVRQLDTAGAVTAPRPDPTGRAIAYVSEGSLHLIDVDGGNDRVLAASPGPDVSYGLPEHVAAESFARQDGFWWAPDGSALLVARVDNSALPVTYLADPSAEREPPRQLRYPFAGGPNAEVTLHILGLDGEATEVVWDRDAFEYLLAAYWDEHGPLIAVQNRAQTEVRLLTVDPATGVTTEVHAEKADSPLPVRHGVPARLAGGELVWLAHLDDARRLLVAGAAVTPTSLQVREIVDVSGDSVLFHASSEPTEVHVYEWSAAGGLRQLSDRPGVHAGVRGGGTVVLASRALEIDGVRTVVRAPGRPDGEIGCLALPTDPVNVEIFSAGMREIRTAVLLPRDPELVAGPLPVLFAPYGGPGGQQVLRARDSYRLSQWFADQGFAVVVADGRGTPARGKDWEDAIWLDKAGPALDDQIAVIEDVKQRYPQLDFGRVAIHGWSLGGFLTALAVLRRPDVFHVGISGAPVTDFRMYDTHWAERYLGHPDEHAEAYDRCTLMRDAPNLQRPLLLVHGLADDNVLPAHTFQLSDALTAAGKVHSVLPLRGTSHMISNPRIAVNLRLIELEFIRNALGIATPA
ncbi:MAG: dipeptidyl-peptidase 4 [Pseudonocardiales bacterium]|jgi:dipeptidyl-peptidase-4|nr:dipeptidyl-peptidase 4 [Pseudonocardiales bacterium]